MDSSGNSFRLGRIVITPGALDALGLGPLLHRLITRHSNNDWGDVDEEDKATNDRAVSSEMSDTHGTTDEDYRARVVSSYKLPSGLMIWIITEWDRSVTTVLLPSEY